MAFGYGYGKQSLLSCTTGSWAASLNPHPIKHLSISSHFQIKSDFLLGETSVKYQLNLKEKVIGLDKTVTQWNIMIYKIKMSN